jgi:hypothetical protein
MKTARDIKDLSSKIWKNCVHRPTRIKLEPFDKELEKIDIKEFIIYNFLYHHGTSLTELLLSTFQFWHDLTLQEWKQIFDRLKGNNLAEYYIAIFSNQYLGIDPKFKSTKNVEIFYITVADNKQQSGKPSLFVENMVGELRRIEEENLRNYFCLSISDFVSIKNRLNSERIKEPKTKNFWNRIWNK